LFVWRQEPDEFAHRSPVITGTCRPGIFVTVRSFLPVAASWGVPSFERRRTLSGNLRIWLMNAF